MERQLIRDLAQAHGILEWAVQEPKVGFDIETSGLGPQAILAGFSLHLPTRSFSCYIPTHHVDYKLSQDDLLVLANKVSTLRVVTYNGISDAGFWLYKFGVTPKIVGDGDIINKMLQTASARTYGLKNIAQELGTLISPIHLQDLLGPGNYDFTQVPLDHPLLINYTTQDAEQALLVEEALRKRDLRLDKYPDFESVYRLELDILPYLGREELRGIPVDLEAFTIVARRMEMEADDLADEICRELGRDRDNFELASPYQLSAALFNRPDRVPEPLPPRKPRQRKIPVQDSRDLPGLGLTPVSPGKEKGKYEYFSTATLELERLEDQHPIIPKILEWKSLNSITRDVKNLHNFVVNGRLHPQFKTVGEDSTSRVYTAQPNAISLSKTVRAAMPPGPGKIYVHVDYRAAEWRLAAIMAGERKILDALDSGADPHKLTYSEMTGTPLDQVTSDQRDVGKVLNYAALFGSTGYSLARSLKCSESEASQKSKDFWSAYPALARWRDERHQYAKQHAKTLTILGRVRKLPEIFYNNKADHAKALRRSVNTSTQGSCGDVLKLAIRNFYIQADSPNTPLGRLGARIVCPVFDAALVEIVLPSELKEGTEDFETWKSMMETELRKVFEIPLQYRGVSSKMLVDMHWSTVSWLHAMGKS